MLYTSRHTWFSSLCPPIRRKVSLYGTVAESKRSCGSLGPGKKEEGRNFISKCKKVCQQQSEEGGGIGLLGVSCVNLGQFFILPFLQFRVAMSKISVSAFRKPPPMANISPALVTSQAWLNLHSRMK